MYRFSQRYSRLVCRSAHRTRKQSLCFCPLPPLSSSALSLRTILRKGTAERSFSSASLAEDKVPSTSDFKSSEKQKTNNDVSRRRGNAARSIPYWLGNDSDCFEWTLQALQLKQNHSEYRQVYLDSLPSFFQAIMERLDEDAKIGHVLDRLVDARFDDLQFAKTFRQMKKHKKDLELLDKRVERKQAQLAERQENLRAIQKDLDELTSFENTTHERSEAPLKVVRQSESNSGFFSGLLGNMLSSWIAPSVSTQEKETQMPTEDNTKHQRKILKQQHILAKAQEAVDSASEKLKHLLAERDAAGPTISLQEYEATAAVVKDVLHVLCPIFAVHISERHQHMIEQYQMLDSKTDLTKPHEWYMYARLDRRKIIYHGGPTNSGKTYQALQSLIKAKKGLYVGPLRLLAAEIYETLTSQGVYTNLFTGQEKREIPFATHVSATVELAPTNEEFDVVVIDEIQMLCDPFRGFAWTRALLGIRCKEIHVCGGMEARELVSKIARDCGDEFEVREYRRFSELNVADKSLAISSNALGSYKNVRPGDCVVAFSRADIFAIKREIENSTKYKCCVVYGSLPPETRTDQARRFNNPDSGFDILVASDAIGMGLNLNIRRIIFNSLYKSNGEMIIKLDHSSVKQIAGRAGRRNSPFPEGEVTCRDPRDMEYLRKCMATEIAPITKAGLLPTPVHIELFSHTLQTYGLSKDYENLHKMLGRFSELATLQGDFFLCRQTPMRVIARILTDLNIPLRDKFTLCMAPVAVNNDRSMITLRKFAIKHAHGEVAGLNRSFFPKPAKSFDDLANLCSTHSDLELFLWLHNRFPGGNMMEQQSANVLKERAIEYINRGLKQTENLRFDHCYLKRDARLREMVKKRQKGEDQQDDIDDYIGRVDLADI